ncbi:hypothetical protein TWF730_009013 [Orbilia blumenaviensis]|uniref:Uncharacterized protein n=1 Tax=Orbilia blumenaviensis TaxID=1796055 RepID=A0AAV9V132_9PEZI
MITNSDGFYAYNRSLNTHGEILLSRGPREPEELQLSGYAPLRERPASPLVQKPFIRGPWRLGETWHRVEDDTDTSAINPKSTIIKPNFEEIAAARRKTLRPRCQRESYLEEVREQEEEEEEYRPTHTSWETPDRHAILTTVPIPKASPVRKGRANAYTPQEQNFMIVGDILSVSTFAKTCAVGTLLTKLLDLWVVGSWLPSRKPVPEVSDGPGKRYGE